MEAVKNGLRVKRKACKSCFLSLNRPGLTGVLSQFPPQRTPSRRISSATAPYERTILLKRPICQSRRRVHNDHHHAAASLVDQSLKRAQDASDLVLNHSSTPTESQTTDALSTIRSASIHVLRLHDPEAAKLSGDDNLTPASALLNLDRKIKPTSTITSQPLMKIVDTLSNLAYQLLLMPNVFITPAILESYVKIQCLLLRPASFPEIFDLYATKPEPGQATSPDSQITYKEQDPSAISAAISTELADSAISAAIAIRNLPLTLSIISTTYQTPAFKRSKIFRKALAPAIGAAMAPVAAYLLASQLSVYQTALDSQSFTTIAFAGMFTYILSVGTIGTVALTTANDQMERVTWAVGMPLRERWIREDERAAVDRVAMAWGFREKSRRGEEEGEEWEALREWIGVRGMVLDKIGLMEGME